MRSILLTASILFLFCAARGQALTIDPSPGVWNQTMVILIDVNQTSDGLKSMLMNHPEQQDSVYLWCWLPGSPVDGNGQWGQSSFNMKMTHLGNMLYGINITPSTFFTCTEADFYAGQLSCLAKLRNGNAFASDGAGEAKTEDLSIWIVPTAITENPTVARAPIILWPNPASDFVSLEIPDDMKNEVLNIYDARMLLVSQVRLAGGLNRIDTSELAAGIYFIRMENMVAKFMIESL
jgi:hypothetical protein